MRSNRAVVFAAYRRRRIIAALNAFRHIAGNLHAEQVALRDIAAQFATPCYVYSRAALEQNWRAFDAAFGDHPHRICYAVKANGNLAVLDILARLGCGFDIVSGGELRRVLAAGGAPDKIIFSGVGKQDWEIREALAAGVGCFNIESISELRALSTIAAAQKKIAAVSVRLNPDVDAKTHPYISTGLRENKFGLAAADAITAYRTAHTDPNLRVIGVACHIGSQLTDIAPFVDALNRVLDFVEKLAADGIDIAHIDFGGGLGVRYRDETPPSAAQYAAAIVAQVKQRNPKLSITIEPGRAIVGDAGILLTRALYLKHGMAANFCVVDAGMNDFIRPALYAADHEIVEVAPPNIEAAKYDVVGPVCESSDFLAKNRALKVREGDLLAIKTAGAYCAAMTSNYNARPRPAEVMVCGDAIHLIRARESLEDLYRGEAVLPT